LPGDGRNRTRPVRNRMIGWERAFSTLNGEPVGRPTQTVPSGMGLFLNTFLAVNCQDFGELSRVATFK
jgi:hypothetical protein